jgi:hypothetical protein
MFTRTSLLAIALGVSLLAMTPAISHVVSGGHGAAYADDSGDSGGDNGGGGGAGGSGDDGADDNSGSDHSGPGSVGSGHDGTDDDLADDVNDDQSGLTDSNNDSSVELATQSRCPIIGCSGKGMGNN